MTVRPEVVKFTYFEANPDGGLAKWHEFKPGSMQPVFALKFDNGDVWDPYNGWRPLVEIGE